MVAVRFFNNVYYYALHMHRAYRVVTNQHFQSTLLGGREGSHKIVLCVRF